MTPDSTPRRPIQPWLILTGLIAGLAAGFFLGKSRSSTGESEGVGAPSFETILAEADDSGLGNAGIRRMLNAVESLNAEQIGSAIDLAQSRNQLGRVHELVRMLYSRWEELDRAAALQHALNQTGDQQHFSLSPILGLWAAKEPMEAWQWFEENSAGLSSSLSGNSILAVIARDDPEKALALRAESSSLGRSGFSASPSSLYSIWCLKDPAAAVRHLETDKNPGHRRQIISSIARTWAEKDPEAAWQWAKSLARNVERQAAMKTIISWMAGRDPEDAKNKIAEFPRGRARSSAISSVTGRIAMSDPEAAFALVREQQPEAGAAISFSQIFTWWGNRDPEKAFAVARDQLQPGSERNMAISNIINTVAGQDIDRAIGMLEELGSDFVWTVPASSIARNLTQRDVERAIAWAEGLPDGEVKQTALQEVISGWNKEAPEAAAAWALAADSEDLLRYAVSSWSYSDARATVKWANENLEEQQQRMLIPSAVYKWGESDIQAASEWVEAIPGGEFRDACLTQLAYAWGMYDAAGGEAWLESQEAGPVRDQAIGNFVSRMASNDPQKALEWAGKIEDADSRERTVMQTAQRYLRSQPENARESIRTSDLPEELKRTLLGEN